MTTTGFDTTQFETFFKKGFETATQNFDEASTMAKQNVEAVMTSANKATKGSEEILTEMLSYTKKTMEEGVSLSKSLYNVKSVEDLMAAQTDFTKSMFDSYVSEVTKLTDMMFSTAKETFEPINARVSAVGDVASKTTKSSTKSAKAA